MRLQEIRSAVTEVAMRPGTLLQWAESDQAQQMKMGFEVELAVLRDDLLPGEDPEIQSVDQIKEFFGDTQTTKLGLDRLSKSYKEWFRSSFWDTIVNAVDEYPAQIRDYLSNNYDFAQAQRRAKRTLDLKGDSFTQTDVDRLAETIKTRDIDKILKHQNSAELDDALEVVRSELIRDSALIQNLQSNRFSMNEFLSTQIPGGKLSDLLLEYGFEWPAGNPGGPTLAEKFAQDLGYQNVVGSNIYHDINVGDRVNHWVIEPDDSIEPSDSENYEGFEIVSPVLSLSQALEALESVYAWAKQNGYKTNRSTGLHINISFPGFDTESLDYIKLAIFSGDQQVIKQFGRIDNQYVHPAMQKIQSKIDQLHPERILSLLQAVKQNLSTAAEKIIGKTTTRKYTSLNLKQGYVEFRSAGGDYLNRPIIELISTALRYARALSIAADPAAYRQEYAKKLYKLLSAQIPDSKTEQMIKLFSSYVTSQSDHPEFAKQFRDLLKQQLQQKRNSTTETRWEVVDQQQPGKFWIVSAATANQAVEKIATSQMQPTARYQASERIANES